MEKIIQKKMSEQKTSIWSILALIFAFIFPILGIIFGIVALIEIKNKPDLKGKGLAIAGIIIGATLILLLIFLIFVGFIAYVGVLDPEKFLPSKCTMSPGLSCPDFKVTPNSIDILMENSRGFTMQNVAIEAENCGKSNTVDSLLNNARGTFRIICKNPLKIGKYSGTITVTFTDTNGITHNVLGILDSNVR